MKLFMFKKNISNTTIFVSHSSNDNEITNIVQEWLTEQGYGSVFVDYNKDNGLVGGKEWWPQLSENLKRTKVFLALVSTAWMNSKICLEELAIARHEGKPIIVLHCDNCELNEYLRQI